MNFRSFFQIIKLFIGVCRSENLIFGNMFVSSLQKFLDYHSSQTQHLFSLFHLFSLWSPWSQERADCACIPGDYACQECRRAGTLLRIFFATAAVQVGVDLCYIVCIPELVQFQYRKKLKEEHRFWPLGDVSTTSGGLISQQGVVNCWRQPVIDPLAESCYEFPIGFPCPRISVQARNTGRVKMVGASPTWEAQQTENREMSHDVAFARGIFNMSVALALGSYSSFEYLRRQTFNGWVLDKAPCTFRKRLGRRPKPIKTTCLVPSKHRLFSWNRYLRFFGLQHVFTVAGPHEGLSPALPEACLWSLTQQLVYSSCSCSDA